VSSHVAAGTRLEKLASGLARHGPGRDRAGPAEPGISYVAIRHLAAGRYAEVSMVRHAPDPGTWYLPLSYRA
jgi:hypothetical protein